MQLSYFGLIFLAFILFICMLWKYANNNRLYKTTEQLIEKYKAISASKKSKNKLEEFGEIVPVALMVAYRAGVINTDGDEKKISKMSYRPNPLYYSIKGLSYEGHYDAVINALSQTKSVYSMRRSEALSIYYWVDVMLHLGTIILKNTGFIVPPIIERIMNIVGFFATLFSFLFFFPEFKFLQNWFAEIFAYYL